MDGIDVAYLESDGEAIGHLGGHLTVPYTDQFRGKLRALIASGSGPERDGNSAWKSVEGELTQLHAAAVKRFMAEESLSYTDVDLVGFHGHTTDHNPNQGYTVQIGDGSRLSRLLNLPVVHDFRSKDVWRGGQGALWPRFSTLPCSQPWKNLTAVLNIGGVANVTWIGKNGTACCLLVPVPGMP